MGAVSNLRPDLFRAVVSLVPFVDVLNTMLDDTLPLTVGEYEEWGNPNERDAYFRIKAYCPYTNIKAQPYPTMLVRTSLNDSQVMYWEPAKYVAKLRALKTDDNPLSVQDQHGRRSRRRVGAVRLFEGDGAGLRVHFVGAAVGGHASQCQRQCQCQRQWQRQCQR